MSEQAESLSQRIEKALDRVSVKAVFGKPFEQGGVTVIPVAQISMGFGYGYGYGTAPAPCQEEGVDVPVAEPGGPAPGGVGGGGGGGARPVGYIQFDARGAHFEPILDITRMGMAGIAMVAWAVFWIATAVRSARKKGR